MALLFASMEIGKATAFGPDVSLAKESAKHIFDLLDRKPAIEITADATYCPVNIRPYFVPDYYFSQYTIARTHTRTRTRTQTQTHTHTNTHTHTPLFKCYHCVFRIASCQPSCDGEVTLDDVEFTYPSRPEAPVLRGLTVAIKPGQRVALVGQSGCGKSTCVSLVERFYDANGGSVVSEILTEQCWGSLHRSTHSSLGTPLTVTTVGLVRPTLSHKLSRQVGLLKVCVRLRLHTRYR